VTVLASASSAAVAAARASVVVAGERVVSVAPTPRMIEVVAFPTVIETATAISTEMAPRAAEEEIGELITVLTEIEAAAAVAPLLITGTETVIFGMYEAEEEENETIEEVMVALLPTVIEITSGEEAVETGGDTVEIVTRWIEREIGRGVIETVEKTTGMYEGVTCEGTIIHLLLILNSGDIMGWAMITIHVGMGTEILLGREIAVEEWEGGGVEAVLKK